MNLDESIKYFKENSNHIKYGKQNEQLYKWLIELKALRSKIELLEERMGKFYDNQ